MTSKFSIDNRELLQRISSGEAVVGIDFGNLIVRELAAFRLAAMDSEPVAVIDLANLDYLLSGADADVWPPEREEMGDVLLYRHPQPAQVVPEEATPDSIEILASARRRDHAVFQWDEDQRNAAADSWNAFRAAMLQELKKSAGTEAICRSDENVQVLHTKSPAQSDCFPEQNGVAPAQSPIDHGYRPECECSGCKATARICAELSANSPANPDCWCRTCRPVVLNDMRFVVCPDCGNKRCPRANDHRNSCTGSNEPGQEGSAYPDTPQEVNHD
ncbi:Uncharacterised protein [Klebsiella pneumoniae]|uniref:hypothetical protein n=1 Tax=Klebsiella pneumoniae TaxID=573 RepID=UPI000E2C1F0D|nr:hypothetical protein [Klebsiella pneumoniae]SVZ53274.1 Uncharacterised protein [Klebsiella pneumoniae]